MIYLYWVLGVFNPISLVVVYILYAILYIARAKHSYWTIPFYIVTFIGAIIDVVVNATWFTIIFWKWPGDWMLTERIERLKEGDGRRAKLAILLCLLLNRILPGHCK